MSDVLLNAISEFQRCISARDAQGAAHVIDDGYALVLAHPSKVVMARDRWLLMLPDYVIHRYDIEEQAVDIDDDCAAVLQRVRMEATVVGEDRSGLFVISDVWRQRDGQWRLWRRHSTPLHAGPMPVMPS